MNVYRGCTKWLYKKGGEGKTRSLKTKEQMLKQHRTAQVVETAFQSISQGQPTCSSPTRQPILRHEKQEGKRRLHTTCTSSHESNVHKRKSRETQCAPQPCTKAAQLWGPGSPVASNAALRVRPFCEDNQLTLGIFNSTALTAPLLVWHRLHCETHSHHQLEQIHAL